KSGFASNNEEVIEDISLFHAEKEKLLGEMPEKVFAESVVHKTTFNDTRQHYEGVCGKRFKLKRRKVELWAKIGLWDTSERLYIQQPFGFLED
ncbi:hypothetical protein HOK09_00170, partial [Candidatus Woesearchaeota archaeon]|nr:hypothetical protein [Candidatus Woesearchaeota archaeon]